MGLFIPFFPKGFELFAFDIIYQIAGHDVIDLLSFRGQ